MRMTRDAIERLCVCLDADAEMLGRFPLVRADVRQAAAVLRALVEKTGVPIGVIEVTLENDLPAVSHASQHNS